MGITDMKKLLAILILFVAAHTLNAQKITNTDLYEGWKIYGMSQIIPYVDGRDFNNDTYMMSYATMKTRLGVEKWLNKHVGFTMEMQDSRVWGQEPGLTSDNSSLEMIQGYVTFDNIFNAPLSAQVGRFQMNYGTGRFISNSFWNYHERAFDGVRFGYKAENWHVDLFRLNERKIGANTGQMVAAVPANWPTDEINEFDAACITGLYFRLNVTDKSNLDLTFFSENDATDIVVPGDNDGETKVQDKLERMTGALSFFGNYGDLSTTLEGALQFGNVSGKDIAAYLAALEIGYNFKPLQIKGGLEMHSGTAYDETEKINAYQNRLGAKHKFMGMMDYFVSKTPYGDAGVNDFYLGLVYGGKKTDWVFGLTGHMFTTNAKTASDESAYGQEIDFTVKYNITKGAFFEFGTGFFMQGEYMKQVYSYKENNEIKYREDLGAMMYLRTVVKL